VKRASTGLVLLLVSGALWGCGGGRDERPARPGAQPAPRKATPPPPAAAPACEPGSERALGDGRVAYFALVKSRARAYRAPARRPFAAFGRTNVNDFPTVLGVLGAVLGPICRPAWYRVQLPMRPNGVLGYVRARDVALGTVRTRVVVDLSERRVTLLRDGRRVLQAAAAVGAPATPTPTGRFYVNQLLLTDDPSGPFGPGAIGISAFSEVLRDLPQGGPIAIHGTNAPWSVGRAVSHGCVRLANGVLKRLLAATPAGTPVIIRA